MSERERNTHVKDRGDTTTNSTFFSPRGDAARRRRRGRRRRRQEYDAREKERKEATFYEDRGDTKRFGMQKKTNNERTSTPRVVSLLSCV